MKNETTLIIITFQEREAATAVDGQISCILFIHTNPGHLSCDTRETNLHIVQRGLREITISSTAAND